MAANPFGPIVPKKPPKQADFTLEGLTIAMIKHAGVHEGLWKPIFHLQNVALEIAVSQRKGPALLTPANITSIIGASLVRCDEPSDLTVDAAQVNPETPRLYVPASVN